MRQRMRPVDLAKLLGRTADWLRRLERQGRIPVAKRDFSGHRYYDADDLARIRDLLARRSSTRGISPSQERFVSSHQERARSVSNDDVQDRATEG